MLNIIQLFPTFIKSLLHCILFLVYLYRDVASYTIMLLVIHVFCSCTFLGDCSIPYGMYHGMLKKIFCTAYYVNLASSLFGWAGPAF